MYILRLSMDIISFLTTHNYDKLLMSDDYVRDCRERIESLLKDMNAFYPVDIPMR